MATKAVVTIDEAIPAEAVLSFLNDPTSVDLLAFKEDPEAIAKRITDAKLAAESLEQLLGGTETVKARDFINKPFQALSVDFRPSDIEGEGTGVYAVIEIVDGNGERHALTCGGRGVVENLAIMAVRGWFPASVKIIEGKQTAAGYKPLDLVAAGSF